MRILLASVVALLMIASEAVSCSFMPGYSPFEVNPDNFESIIINGNIASLPAPKVVIDKITRGRSDKGGACEDAGIIDLTITWPENSIYSIENIGFYFQSSNGLKPNFIFPPEPVSGDIKGNKVSFFFVWLDGHPENQHNLDFSVNVFAVNKGLHIGHPTIVKIKAKKG